ncbi:putative aspartic protease, partial [Cucurbita argyrosperma subsp. sororia]
MQNKLQQIGRSFRAKSRFYTHLVLKEPDTFYYLTLEAMSVANKRFKATNDMSAAAEQGNILIDSSTTLTILPPNFYKGVASTLARVVKAKRVDDPIMVGRTVCLNQLTDLVRPIQPDSSGLD